MTNELDVDGQLDLLEKHRITLNHYLKQKAMFSEAYVPPHIVHGILEARSNIARIKQQLVDWDVSVENHPDDEEKVINDFSLRETSVNQRPLHRRLDLLRDLPTISDQTTEE